MQQTIQPGDQMWVSLNDLIRNRTADRKGNVLPVDVSAGTYELRDMGGRGLRVSSVALDTASGTQAPPPYPRCCGTDPTYWNPDFFDVVIDGLDFGSIQGTDQCTGQVTDISTEFTDWWSGNTAVAAVTTKQVHGVSAGSTDAFASGRIAVGNGGYCTFVPDQLQASVAVGQTVSLAQTDCNTGFAELTAGWGNLKNLNQCSLADIGPPLPSGGSCVTNGTVNGAPRNCYQVNTTTCSITYCPGSTRIVNSSCTKFLDSFPLVQVTVPAGCTQ